MPERTYTVHVVAGELRREWCATCQTSAGFEVDVFAVSDRGLSKLKTLRGCDRCKDRP